MVGGVAYKVVADDSGKRLLLPVREEDSDDGGTTVKACTGDKHTSPTMATATMRMVRM
jgi:hypothetical protein